MKNNNSIVTPADLAATWANADKTPRVDAPRNKAKAAKAVPTRVNHAARYKVAKRLKKA